MYPRLLLKFCERSLYRISSGVRLNVRRLGHVAKKDEKEREAEPVSTKFPDYKVIYVFPFVKHVSGINIVKRRFTIFAAIATPVIFGLHLASILPVEITAVSIITGKISITQTDFRLFLNDYNLYE
jgi:hypothetical protein